MLTFFTPEQVVGRLQVETTKIMCLIKEQNLKAIRLPSGKIRIPQPELGRLVETCPAVPLPKEEPTSG
jgi:hypothetical protein